jgi:adenylate cyclase
VTDPLAELDNLLLHGRPRFTRLQAATLAGITVAEADRLWNALGFASVPDGVVAFTDSDVQALAHAGGLIEAGLIEAESLRSMTRMVGQGMSRLAEWQARLLAGLLARRPELLGDGDLAGFVGRVEPALEQMQLHVWRRHLAATARRLLADQASGPVPAEVVGFADLAGYTGLSRQLRVRELGEVLEEFETLVSDLVAEHHGRVVKTIGDEVLFVLAEPEHAAALALRLQQAVAASATLPPLRIGLAQGELLARFGDVYGPVVNIASRLTGLARPGTVLIDRVLAETLQKRPAPGCRVHRIRTASVRGYPRLTPYRLRPA